MTTPLRFDPIAEAARLRQVDDVLRPQESTFARYELLMLLSFTRDGRLPMTEAGARLRVHPAGVTNAASRLETAGLVVRRPDPADGRLVLVETMVDTLQELRRKAGDFAS